MKKALLGFFVVALMWGAQAAWAFETSATDPETRAVIGNLGKYYLDNAASLGCGDFIKGTMRGKGQKYAVDLLYVPKDPGGSEPDGVVKVTVYYLKSGEQEHVAWMKELINAFIEHNLTKAIGHSFEFNAFAPDPKGYPALFFETGPLPEDLKAAGLKAAPGEGDFYGAGFFMRVHPESGARDQLTLFEFRQSGKPLSVGQRAMVYGAIDQERAREFGSQQHQ